MRNLLLAMVMACGPGPNGVGGEDRCVGLEHESDVEDCCADAAVEDCEAGLLPVELDMGDECLAAYCYEYRVAGCFGGNETGDFPFCVRI